MATIGTCEDGAGRDAAENAEPSGVEHWKATACIIRVYDFAQRQAVARMRDTADAASAAGAIGEQQ